MAAKRALVVDDSKSARIVLSRMLEKYAIEVDAAESAEAALEYLRANRPDVIFMDHMMPGMDGLQAVRQIKANPEIATIPIMMYTSQEGELYAGQARALGAVGVLPKSIRPIDVTKALYQLNMLQDRRDITLPVLQPYVGEKEEAAAELRRETESAMPGEWRAQVETILREQNLELRRFMLVTLEAQLQRAVSELRPPEPDLLPPPPPPPPRPWGWIMATVLALVGVTLVGMLYWQSLESLRQLRSTMESITASQAEMKAALDNAVAGNASMAADTGLQAIAPRVTLIEVPFGEPALSPARLDALRDILAQYEREGLRGRVQVTVHAGSFCLARVGEQGYALARPATAAADCDQIGNPHDELQGDASRQPVAFANLAASVLSRTGGEIELRLAVGARDPLLAPYPRIEQATAGQWNTAAQSNNRIEVRVEEP